MNKERISHKEEAQKALSRGEWKKALESFQAHCADEPDDLRSRLRVGDLLDRLGRKKEAVEVYREVAEAYAGKGFFPQAISVYKIVLRVDPSQEEARDRLDQLARQKDLEEAFSRALAGFPLFSELDETEFQSLLRHVQILPFSKDSFLCREG